MPYYEVKEKIERYELPRGPLHNGDLVVGHIKGKPMAITVLGDDTIQVEKQTLGRTGFIFDKEGWGPFGNRRGLVWLNEDEEEKLRYLHCYFVDGGGAPGAFLDSLGSLWRKTERQAGLRDDRMTLGRYLLGVISCGRTEDFQ